MTDKQKTIRESIDRLKTVEKQVFEIRALGVPKQYGKDLTVAGFYRDYDRLAQDATKLDDVGAKGIYVVLNPIHEDLLCYAPNQLVESPEHTTRDVDILKRTWLYIDVDPVRRADISSNDVELSIARDRAKRLEAYIRKETGAEPDVVAFSGNGYHLLYRIDLPNTDASTETVKARLDRLSLIFSDNAVTIDTSVFNAARICKLYGTTARKGFSVPSIGRIHRVSRILRTGGVA